MTYIELVNQFWRIDKQARFSNTETRLYFALLNIANGLYWKTNELSLANSRLMSEANCSRKTLRNARERLVEYQLIQFRPGVNRTKAPIYLINTNKISCVNSTRVNSTRVIPSTTLPSYERQRYNNNGEKTNNDIKEQERAKAYDFIRNNFKNYDYIIKRLKNKNALGNNFADFMYYLIFVKENGSYLAGAKEPVSYIVKIAKNETQWADYQQWQSARHKKEAVI